MAPEKKSDWYVITGAPCSGKTSVIMRLAQMGYQTVAEAARGYIDEELRKGATLSDIKRDMLAFEEEILRRKQAVEGRLSPGDRVFFDRGIPDSVAYYRQEGLDDTRPLEACSARRYAGVFLLDRLRFEKDRVRTEDECVAGDLEARIIDVYRELGYDIVRVPVMPVASRVGLILGTVRGSRP